MMRITRTLKMTSDFQEFNKQMRNIQRKQGLSNPTHGDLSQDSLVIGDMGIFQTELNLKSAEFGYNYENFLQTRKVLSVATTGLQVKKKLPFKGGRKKKKANRVLRKHKIMSDLMYE